jgi:hypothetical protein
MFSSKQLLSLALLSAVLFTCASAQARSVCTRNGTVAYGNTCNSFSAREDVSAYGWHWQLWNAGNNPF